MLETLAVRNLAVVKEARLDLCPGLNTITGETGAGKSVLLGSLGLLLGERPDRQDVRAGEEEASVEAVFVLADSAGCDEVLEQAGLPACEDGMLLIRRTVPASGPSRAFVNGAPAAVQTLRVLGELLVDLHGPHEHQSLLNPAFQLEVLDAFAGLEREKASYAEAYSRRGRLEAARSELEGDEGTLLREIEMLRYQVEEIEAAGLTEEMEEELRAEFAQVANAGTIAAGSGAVLNLLEGEEGSAFAALQEARRELEKLRRFLPEAADWLNALEEAALTVQDLLARIQDRVAGIDFSPERESFLEEQLSRVGKLTRKYGGDVPAVLAFAAGARRRLDDLEGRGQRLAELEGKIAAAGREISRLGRELSEQRKKAARRLRHQIEKELDGLGFPRSVFEIGLETVEPGPSGLDRVEYIFSPNAGEPPRPLRAVASSGEISRVMLAIKAVLGKHDRIPVLVFDEIDANVGGEMGTAIGKKLRDLARNRQVLCITHLPQVAVFGDNHLVVSKHLEKQRTLAEISRVEGESRVEEVARMLGGKDVTSVALRHAGELLEKPARGA